LHFYPFIFITHCNIFHGLIDSMASPLSQYVLSSCTKDVVGAVVVSLSLVPCCKSLRYESCVYYLLDLESTKDSEYIFHVNLTN
jgi:type III secretory pathway component EscT